MIRKSMQALVATLGVTAMVAGASSAQAAVTFDPDGAGPLSAVSITGLDWKSGGNALAVGGNAAVGNYVTNQLNQNNDLDTTFYTYYQATLESATNGNTTVSNADLSNYEISVVAKFKETVTGVSGNNASFSVVSDAANYVEFYASPKNANYAAGTGFNDGVLILSGTITGGGSTFNVNTLLGTTALATNSAIPTVQGSGGGVTFNFLDIVVNSFDSSYFTGIVDLDLDFNGNLTLPFAQGLPASGSFLIDNSASSASGLANVTSGAGLGAGNFTALGLGDINGDFVSGGPSIQFQTDGNSSLIGETPVVPEPATAAMGLLGLVGLAAAARRRRNA